MAPEDRYECLLQYGSRKVPIAYTDSLSSQNVLQQRYTNEEQPYFVVWCM